MKKDAIRVAEVVTLVVVTILTIIYITLVSVDVIIAPSAAHAYITEMTGEEVNDTSTFLRSEVVRDRRFKRSIEVLNNNGYHIVILNK